MGAVVTQGVHQVLMFVDCGFVLILVRIAFSIFEVCCACDEVSGNFRLMFFLSPRQPICFATALPGLTEVQSVEDRAAGGRRLSCGALRCDVFLLGPASPAAFHAVEEDEGVVSDR